MMTRTPLRLSGLCGLALVSLLAGCGGDKAPNLMRYRATDSSPDEFMVVPNRTLQAPPSNALPAPTPGGGNLADATPQSDAISALGGNGAAAVPNASGAVPAADGTLLAYADRFGVEGDIRSVTAAEDLQWRRTHKPRLLNRIAGENGYFSAYQPMALDSVAELERLRKLGIRVPAAPPVPVKQGTDNTYHLSSPSSTTGN